MPQARGRVERWTRGSHHTCAPRVTDHQVVAHSDGEYVVIRFSLDCPSAPSVLDFDYGLFFENDAQHRGLLHLDVAGSTSALTFLLPSVLERAEAPGATWEPLPRFRPVLWDVLRTVTAFTVAHSLTLSLAALDVVRLPSRVTESAIAASVLVAAGNNIFPILREDRWVAAFALGLLHGFGFSAAPIDLGLPRSALVLTLFGFNLGVEIGQMAIVLVFLPLAFLARKTIAYRRFALVGGSLAIVLVASVWLIERAFEIKILS